MRIVPVRAVAITLRRKVLEMILLFLLFRPTRRKATGGRQSSFYCFVAPLNFGRKTRVMNFLSPKAGALIKCRELLGSVARTGPVI